MGTITYKGWLLALKIDPRDSCRDWAWTLEIDYEAHMIAIETTGSYYSNYTSPASIVVINLGDYVQPSSVKTVVTDWIDNGKIDSLISIDVVENGVESYSVGLEQEHCQHQLWLEISNKINEDYPNSGLYDAADYLDYYPTNDYEGLHELCMQDPEMIRDNAWLDNNVVLCRIHDYIEDYEEKYADLDDLRNKINELWQKNCFTKAYWYVARFVLKDLDISRQLWAIEEKHNEIGYLTANLKYKRHVCLYEIAEKLKETDNLEVANLLNNL